MLKGQLKTRKPNVQFKGLTRHITLELDLFAHIYFDLFSLHSPHKNQSDEGTKEETHTKYLKESSNNTFEVTLLSKTTMCQVNLGPVKMWITFLQKGSQVCLWNASQHRASQILTCNGKPILWLL
jgi:hypothetical protein